MPTHSAIIHGNEPDYAGKEVTFKVYTDPITRNEKNLFIIKINPDGSFKKEIKVEGTTYCHAEFGVYKGLLIIEQGSDINLKLPSFREKTIPESKNPYFKPVLLWLQNEPAEAGETNKLIASLEKQYVGLTNKYFSRLYYQRSAKYLDSVKIQLTNNFDRYNNSVIKNQLYFKLKLLEADINQAKQKTAFKGVNPVNFSYSNPAFIDLFNLVFDNKLAFEANSIKGANLRGAVAKGEIATIKKYYSEKYGLDNSFADLVVLKILHDAYYTNQFPKQAIISMLEKPFFSGHANRFIRNTSKRIIKKLLFLSKGSPAPAICLKTPEGNQKCSDKIREYAYILFADTEMLVCREHLKYLSTIEKKFKGNNLDIFIVLRHSGNKQISDFLNKANIPGTIVIEGDGNEYSKKYKVRSYPSAFLLNKNHEVILAPAKNPLDGFEQEFASLLRSEQIRKFRNQK